MSLAQSISPSPRPMTSGLSAFATTISPGALEDRTAMAYAPRTRASEARTASTSRFAPPSHGLVDQVGDDLRVRVAR